MPTLYIIAGPNGVGKTTFADRYMPDEAKQLGDSNMKAMIEPWDESFLDIEDYQVERALTNAALDAIHRARRCGTDFVVEENGKPKSLRPDETAPYEKRFLEDLDRISRKIADLEKQSPSSLNDRPQS